MALILALSFTTVAFAADTDVTLSVDPIYTVTFTIAVINKNKENLL